MEFEYAKLMRLHMKQKNIRVEFEEMKNLPVGMEAFQDDYDQKFASELAGEPGELVESE